MPRRVLVVGDNREDRAELAALLGSEYTVVEAEDGKEAYSMLLNNPYGYSLVITGVMTPIAEGCEIVRLIRRSGFMSQIPIIFAAADADEEELTKALNCGADNLISKPYNAQMLLAMVRNNVRLRETASIVNELQKDKLTGLYNKGAFMKEAAKLISRHDVDHYIMGSFDVDHFKVINDQYGTQMGDRVLRHLGTVFGDGFGAIGGIACHVSEDRFALLYPAAFQYSECIEEIRAKAACVEGLTSPLSFCVGRYIVTDTSLSPSIMYDRAVLAGEKAKNNYEKKSYITPRISAKA